MKNRALLVLTACVAAGALQGCAPLLFGGAVMGTAMVATDRRTTGTQVEDEAIELKGVARANEVAPSGHVNVTSYNRMVLITGEVASETDRRAVEQVIGRIENVRSVVNEVAVMGNTSLTARSNDTVLSGKVKIADPAVYALSDAARAHEDLQARRTTGSIILRP